MRDALKKIYFGLIDLIGKNKRTLEKKRPSVTILTYHSVVSDSAPIFEYEYRNCVTVSAFDNQIKMLKKIFKVIPLQEAVERLQTGKLTENYAVVTFDDGYRNNFDYAFSVLKKHAVSAAFFVTTGLIGGNDCLWTDWVTYLVFHSTNKTIELNFNGWHRAFTLNSEEQKIRASIEIRDLMKSATLSEEEMLLKQLKAQVSIDAHPVAANPDRYAFMNWEQVKTMADQGMEIGSHTHRHALLNMLSNEEAQRELAESKRMIEEKTNASCKFFAYPNGQLKDFNDAHIEMMREMGYLAALTQVPGSNKVGEDLFRLKRINISNKMFPPIFKAYVCGTIEHNGHHY
ncbi:polysaccharide deacetylase [Caldithrix abyssi DSM 13497]|uniref:Polysaccharide deacetylase n=1 Tax=Caldithrix abyssi DSM 13497 TaxID=880073 RepID=H1XXD5_CALAY|nr:polysaccharide deacetylase family protein [Caldithrix abyssi]APF17853.1 Polysaccharide deacetylase [Caldithrix abyssi DSM 13497]EHO41920.1 polysaccharide deacetylase [Caldithrix abyssi DSM 13497]